MKKDKKAGNPVWIIFNLISIGTLIASILKSFALISITWLAIFSPLMVLTVFILFIGAIYAAVNAALHNFKKELLEELEEKNYILLNANTNLTMDALVEAQETLQGQKE